MARKQNGGLNRFLNIIGLVDDDRGQDRQAENYNTETYGRPSTYIPARQRGNDTSRGQRTLPAQSGRRSVSSRPIYDEQDRSSRRSSRFENDYEQDWNDNDRSYDRDREPARSRPRSRFEEEEAPSRSAAPQRRAPAANTGNTIMFDVRTLAEVNPVITALVKGNTIIMTIHTDDQVVYDSIKNTMCGAVFALDGTIRNASGSTYLIAPHSVNVKSSFEADDRY